MAGGRQRQPITKIQYRQKEGLEENSFGTWTDIPNSEDGATNAMSYAVPNLTNGVAYTFELQAFNAQGASDASDELAIRAGARPSGTPNVTTTQFWTSNLTVGDTGNAVTEGFSTVSGRSGGTLGNKSIEYKGKSYQINQLWLSGDGQLYFTVTGTDFFDTTPASCDADPVKHWTLHVGNITLDFADANDSGRNGCTWPLANHGVYWSDGPTYSLALSTSEPGAPRDLRASAEEAAVTLSWDAPESGVDTPAITAYHYRYKTDGEYGDWTEIPDSANLRSHRIARLAAVEHTFQLAAENSAGLGLYSDEVTETPRAPCTPPGAPTIGSVTPTGHGKLTMTWSAPTEPGTCGAIDGYEYQVKEGADGTYGTWRDIDDSANLTSYEVTRLFADTTYYLQLRATSGTDNGTESDERSGTTWAPIEVRLVEIPARAGEADGTVTVAVTAETPPGTAKPGEVLLLTLSTADGTALSQVDFEALSENLLFNPEAFSETPPGSGRFRARLTRQVTFVDDGLAEDDEQFEVKLEFIAEAFRYVKIVDDDGEPIRADSRTVVIEDDDHAPEIRTTELIVVVGQTAAGDLVATDADDDELTWRLTGGADEALFTVSEAGVVSLKSPAPASVDMPNDANRDGIYELTVEVTDGANPVSGSLRVRLAVGNLPGAPTDLEANGGRGAVALTWKAPDDDGGVAILRYDYRFRSGGGYGGWLPVPDSGVGGDNERSFTVTDLFGLTAYTFEVRAVNAADAGLASAPATVTTLAACSGGPGPEAAVEGALRLADGGACRGRLEVYHDGRWGTVSDDRMGSNASRPNDAPALACRAMGYEGGRMVPRGTPGMSFPAAPSSRPIWLDDVFCPVGGTNHRDGGPLNTISQCRHAGWGLHNASHDEDVWVECAGAYADPGSERPPPAVPMLSVAPAEATEGEDETLDFTVTLEPEATGTVTVDYATATTADDTATEGDDYTARSGRLVFAPGQTSQTVSVPIVDDDEEDSGETFTLTLSDAVGATIAVAVATGTINNDEAESDEAESEDDELRDRPWGLEARVGEDGIVLTWQDPETGHVRGGGSYRILRHRPELNETEPRVLVEWHTSSAPTFTDSAVEAGVLYVYAVKAATDGVGGLGPASEPVEVRMPGEAAPTVVPLTAAFVGMPPEHDGTKFTFRVRFSEDPAVSYKVLKSAENGAFEVDGGTIAKAIRVNRKDDLREIHVEPSGVGDVTLTLAGGRACGTAGAICTSASAENDSKALSNTLTATVKGPAALSVADARVEEADGATLDFVVSLSRAAIGTVTVSYATGDGDAKEPADYVEKSGTLTFVEGEQEKTVSVEVIDDSLDEGEETMTLQLSDATGATIADGLATGTIENSDHMPKAWLARFGRTVASQVVDAVGQRLAGAPRAGVEVRLAGQALGGAAPDADALAEEEARERLEAMTKWLKGETQDDEVDRSRAVTERDLLTGTSFAATGGSAEGGLGSVWGRGAVSSFSGRSGEVTVSGEVASAMLGADLTRGPWTAGLMVAHSRGDGEYRGADAGEVESTLTGLYPYGRHELSERVTLWGVAGYGEGELTLTREGQTPMETGMDLAMGAVGLRGVAVEAEAGAGPELAVKTDALAVRTSSEATAGLVATTAQVTRLRLGLEGTWRGGALVPRLEVGVRHDGGDAETGFGLDLGGGLAWSDPASGIAAEVSARGLVSHEAGGMRDRGVSGSLAWDPRPDSERGLKLTVSHAMGAPASGGMDALYARPTMAGLIADEDGDELSRRRFEARLGYGFAAFGDRFTATPEVGLGLSNDHREMSLGWRLGLAKTGPASLELRLDGTRREAAGADAPVHGVALRLDARW